MTGATRNILLVADRPGIHDDSWSLVAFLDRLEGLGIDPQVVCIEAAGEAAGDERVVGGAGLGRGWLLPLAVRILRVGERFNRPDLIHVLHGRLGDSAIAVAEHWQVPYV